MKAVVFAYHDMRYQSVQALLDAGHEIATIFAHTNNPDEKAFLGSVSRLAANVGIPVYVPDEVNHPLWIERISQLIPDVIFSFYYRHLLSGEIFSLAPKGTFNLHDSLLPECRGRTPLNWVLVNGETEAGATLRRMIKHADVGAIVAQQRVAISPEDVALTLHHKLCQTARHLLKQILPAINAGSYSEFPQQDVDATCFGRRTSEDGFLDWNKPAAELHNQVRVISDP